VLVEKGIKLASIGYDLGSPLELAWGISCAARGQAKCKNGDVIITHNFSSPSDGGPNTRAKGTKLFGIVFHPRANCETLNLQMIADGVSTGLFKLEKSLITALPEQ
jgi:hypothetical protein